MGLTYKQAEVETFLAVKDQVKNKINLVACPSDFQVGLSDSKSDLIVTGKLTLSVKMYMSGDTIDDATTIALIGGSSVPAFVPVTRAIKAHRGSRNGQILHIKDATGIASTDPISVNFQSPDTLEDGTDSVVLNSNYESVALCWYEGKWYVI
jgi:hypothetical protein